MIKKILIAGLWVAGTLFLFHLMLSCDGIVSKNFLFRGIRVLFTISLTMQILVAIGVIHQKK